MNSFMNSIKSAATDAISPAADGDDKSHPEQPPSTAAAGGEKGHPDQPTSAELLSSAKVVAAAAQSAMSKETSKIEKAKVAGAAADLLDAAEQYGKLDETKGLGQYVKKADDYLHEYEKSGGTVPPPATEAPPPEKADKPRAESGKEESGSGFGAGDAMKMAQGFFK